MKCWSLLLGAEPGCRMPCLPAGSAVCVAWFCRVTVRGLPLKWSPLPRRVRPWTSLSGQRAGAFPPALHLLSSQPGPWSRILSVVLPGFLLETFPCDHIIPSPWFSLYFLEHMSELKQTPLGLPFLHLLLFQHSVQVPEMARIYPVCLFYFIGICACKENIFALKMAYTAPN